MSSTTFRVFLLNASIKFLGKFLAWMGRKYLYPVKIKTLCVLLACGLAIAYLRLGFP